MTAKALSISFKITLMGASQNVLLNEFIVE
jgi:hypothetical protein